MPELCTFRRKSFMPATFVLMALYAAGARAEDTDASIFAISGFGTVGAVHSSEHQADYTNSPWYKPSGAGYSQNWSAGVDSRLALQLDAKFTPQLSAVVQAVSQLRYDNSYMPTLEWANIKYDFTSDFSARLGRIVMSTFLASDYRNVGYAYPWVRPPLDVYNMMPVNTNDGADASYRLHFGEVTNTVQGFYGVDNLKSPGNAFHPAVSNNPARNSWAVFDTTESGPAIFRLAYQHSNLSLDGVNAFFDQFKQFGTQGINLANRYGAYKVPVLFWGASASYDPGRWFLMGEWGKSKIQPSFMGGQRAWYVSSGYRTGNFTPYAAYTESKKLSNISDPGLNLGLVNPFLAGYAAGLNAGLNGFLKPATGKTITLGCRWDFMKNTDLKLQYEHISLDAQSSGLLINLQPGFITGGNLNVVSATVDWVF